ncbi:restriction endonuclease subunit S [Kyrpidia spormannii]|uniref:Restriction modification system DNA specificity domain-containing protein n=2 Tax=Kyrpidia spormannii TaxID=2055160 RepID=A0ACA8ZCE6_9BACL|nr:restriction endonuclease subunit S [Kyrpidia spormannii]CAB3395067.1 Restriction modification system DNA specificity domain-containing protein [Kyrpidia spormannii]CAB3395967.1 Restriction modification system DNA specificity domain-containing protein [Kyrpidia spormannii]
MMGTLNPYPAYKDSGVPWLGQVPEHWEVRRLGSVTQILNGATPSSSRPEYWDGDIVWVTPDDLGKLKGRYIDNSSRRITQEGYNACGTTLAPAGSIVVSTRAPIGHLGILRVAACANQGCRLLVPQAATASEYLYHMLVAARPSLDVLGQGSTFLELSRSKLGSFYIPLPPLPEQNAIVGFLDWADRRIRRVIRARQRRMKLLEEYKQALIHQAVTGRIDVRTSQPYPAYKDSGVEWLGKVPTHWEVLRLKYVARLRSGESITSERIEETGDYPVYGGNGIRGFTSSFTHEGEFVLIGRQGALCGNINYANGRFWASEHAVVVHPLRKCLTHWLGELLRAMNLNQYSIAAAQPGLAVERIQNLTIPFPPIEEQEQIDQYINNQINAFDAAISAARREIELLREYRERLVSDAVTGKVDVREVAARLPEEPPGEESEWMDTEEIAEAEMPDDDAAAVALSEEEVEI